VIAVGIHDPLPCAKTVYFDNAILSGSYCAERIKKGDE